jgi:ribose transport system substrate-binding protein
VNTDQLKFGTQMAQYLVDQLKGKGNVIMVTGVAGTFADSERNKGAEAVFKANPGIKVVAKYSGNWASADAQRATAAQLPSLPTVDGAWVQGGTDGVLKAFVDAGKPLPITGGEAENGFRRFLLPQGYKGHHVQGMSLGQPPFLSLVALELAREILLKKHAKSNIEIPFPFVTDKTVKQGLTVFPTLPDSFFADFTDSGPNATLVICVKAALTGKPCPGVLNVRLPK